jgi:hypothetical protein
MVHATCYTSGMMNNVVEFEKRPGVLVVKLTAEGRANADEILDVCRRLGINLALFDVCEYQLCNGWEVVAGEEIGALTGCEFIITDDAERDDQGKLLRVGSVYWNPNYAVEDEIQSLLTNGQFILAEVK